MLILCSTQEVGKAPKQTVSISTNLLNLSVVLLKKHSEVCGLWHTWSLLFIQKQSLMINYAKLNDLYIQCLLRLLLIWKLNWNCNGECSNWDIHVLKFGKFGTGYLILVGLHMNATVHTSFVYSTAFFVQGLQTFSCRGSWGIVHSYCLCIHCTLHTVLFFFYLKW